MSKEENTKSLSLYQINQDYENCLSQVIDTDTGEVLNENLIEVLNNIQMALEEKALNTAYVIRKLDSRIDAIKNEIDRLKKLKEMAESAEERLKKYLQENIPEGQKIQGDLITISWRKSESVEISDVSKIPKEYIKTKIEESPDKTTIKEALKSGKQVPGAELVSKNNLQIK